MLILWKKDEYMRKWLMALGLCLGSSFAHLQVQAHSGMPEGSFEIGGGYRTDRLHWHVGFGQNVDPQLPISGSSSLRWRDLRIGLITATGRYTNCANIYFRGFATAGQIYHGRAEDKDFLLGQLITESHATANAGHVYDFSGGIGYTFRFLCNRGSISPLIGYSYDVQQLQMNHLKVVFDELGGILGRVPGLHNNYRTRWKGFWFGVDFRLYMMCGLTLFGSAEYHLTHLRAYGHWNLRTDFVKDFKQHARGHGDLYTLGIRYEFFKRFYLAATGIYQGWHTHKGTDKVYLRSGAVESRLRGVFWHSLGFTGTFGVKY
jgi:hypothetical protein